MIIILIINGSLVLCFSRNPTPRESTTHWPVFAHNSTRQVMHIKETMNLTSQLRSSPVYQIWDDIYNCMNNFICDKSIFIGTTTTNTSSDDEEVESKK